MIPTTITLTFFDGSTQTFTMTSSTPSDAVKAMANISVPVYPDTSVDTTNTVTQPVSPDATSTPNA